MDTQDEIKAAHRIVSFVGISVVASLFIYLALVEIFRAYFRPFRGFGSISDVQRFRYGVFAVAIISVILVRALRQALLRKSPQDSLSAGLRKLQRASLVTLVLSEAPAVLGLVLFLLCGLNVDFYLLFLVSLVLVFMYFPRLAQWREWMAG